MNLLNWIEEEEEKREEFYKQMGQDEGYISDDCPNCGRHRLIHWSCGKDICEKCSWCVQTESYFHDYDGNLFY